MIRWISRALARFLPRPPHIEPGEDVVLLDVRTGPEYARSHAAGAVHIPLGELDARWRELEGQRDRRILVYCLSGHRAGRAARALRERGFDHVENAGGIGGLRRAGVEVVRAR